MAKKTKRKAPRVMKWVEMGCAGVTKDGRLRKGYGPPAAKGECPRPGKSIGGQRTKAIVKGVQACSPLFRKSATVGFKRGYAACEKMLPADLKARVHTKKADAEDSWAQVAKAAAAQQAKESSDRAWATSHGIPTLAGHRRKRRKKARR